MQKTDAPQNGGDPEELAKILAEIADRSRSLVEDFVSRQADNREATAVDPVPMGQAFLELTTRMMSNPAGVMQAQFDLWQDYMRLWQSTTQRMMGQPSEPVASPDRSDRRFRDPAWQDNALFDFIKQSYLLSSRCLMGMVGDGEGFDGKTQQKLEFYARQFVDALAPTNFVMTNPEVLRTTLETRGENLLRGLANMLEDLERGKGQLAIKMTDDEAFEVGRNIATTPGKVVYQNELMQLLQYAPATRKVNELPLLIVPPWINKFYILDLRPKNSFIRFAVEQGFTVFVVSWVNPDAELAAKTFEDYMREGVIEAVDAVCKETSSDSLNCVGYCLGGTLMAVTLAYMASKNDQRVKSISFFTTLVDFTDPGELGVFIDEEQLAALEDMMARRGYLEGSEMANTFNMLRANDLIWSFVVNNYLLGKEPFPFDLLYWNSDSTRMPAALHSYYLRRFYHENKMIEPGGICLDGVDIDLRRIEIPVYWVSTKEDHIAPWKSTYVATQIYRGERRFVLAGSGHIAGVVNPPDSGKYGFWTQDELPEDPDAWLETAVHHDGSWWTHWAEWLAQRSGGKVKAREPGAHVLGVLEAAPGSYVKKRFS